MFHDGHISVRSRALMDVAEERERQIAVENYTSHTDDRYSSGELIRAGLSYAQHAASGDRSRSFTFPKSWPWSLKFWKPSTRRRDLVKAAALLIAEIDRMDREEVARHAGDD